jgi:predicted amidohydrolase
VRRLRSAQTSPSPTRRSIPSAARRSQKARANPDGVIAAWASNVTVPAGAQTIDATGKIVTPGLINSLTRVGDIEIGQVRDTNDADREGDQQHCCVIQSWED